MNRREFIQASSLLALANGLPDTEVALGETDKPVRSSSLGHDTGLTAYWPFDEANNAVTLDSATQTEDVIQGNFSFVKGVRGNGIKFDGFTTRIARHSSLPVIHEAVTFEAWIAPQAYPWNWNAIVEQRNRYFFGLDATGHIGLRVLDDNQWRECVSAAEIPFMQWSHIAASFDPSQGLTLYINGQEAGRLQIAGHLTPGRINRATGLPTEGSFQIGRNLEEIPAASSRKIPASYSFDGIIDELKIYNRSLNAEEIKASYASLRPAAPPALAWRKLPVIRNGQSQFGAFYTRLNFDPEWDQLWRTDEYPDLVVTFKDAAYKMVFWHGTTYNMNMVTENGRWIGDQSAEAPPEKYGCVEHMSDKQCRYSHVRLLESSSARVVVHWRYALTDVLYNIGERDPITGWGDWADEYYTIYPDGMAVRHFLIHGPLDHYSITEPATLNNPGEKAEDNVSIQAATLANMNGETRTFSWETWPSNGDVRGRFANAVPNANIAIVNTKSEFKPVYIYEPGALIIPYGGGAIETRPWFSKFPIWNHWPVAQIPSDGRDALALDRVSSSAILSPEPPQTRRARDGALEGRFLMGLTNQPMATVLPIANAWLNPPSLKLTSDEFASDGYSRNDRAYHLRRLSKSDAKLVFTIRASDKSPAVNPAFVVDGWGRRKASLRLNGKPAVGGKDFLIGHIDRLEGSSLVVWVLAQLTESSTFWLAPTPE
ncbi:MAG: LamG domain-containing protein [Acidobacteriaceae bacterium]